jgi:hypothetical protein
MAGTNAYMVKTIFKKSRIPEIFGVILENKR